MTTPHEETLERFEQELARQRDVRYELTLFVSGASELSGRAIANARRLCETHLAGRYELSVVDIHQSKASVDDEMLATPTLVRTLPLPVRKLVGDLSRTDTVLHALGLPVAGSSSGALRS